MLRGAMGTSPTSGLVSYLRALLFVVWGVAESVDPPPRVLIER
jgi:hypothetical protein